LAGSVSCQASLTDGIGPEQVSKVSFVARARSCTFGQFLPLATAKVCTSRLDAAERALEQALGGSGNREVFRRGA